MPPAVNISAKLWGKQFRFPPNRPNDRATLIPWRPEWGLPGYFYQAGRRIPVTGEESMEQIAKLFGEPLTPEQRAETDTLSKTS